MRLIPGVAVSSIVLASIDTNADGVISETEQRAYAKRVLGDVSLTVDGNRLSLRLVFSGVPEDRGHERGTRRDSHRFYAQTCPKAAPPGNSSSKTTTKAGSPPTW